MTRLTNLIKEALRTPLHELEERFKVIDTRTGEVIDNDLPKKIAQKLAAKKTEWTSYPDKKESTIAKIAKTLDESKKKDCNCGCNTCENVGNEGVLLNESVAPKQILSENLQYHVHNKLPLTENTFRYGSQSFINLWAEARSLYLREIIHVNDDDKEILTETDLGNYGMYEGKKVPLGLPMENTVNESEDLDKIRKEVEKIAQNSPGKGWTKKSIDQEVNRRFQQFLNRKPMDESEDLDWEDDWEDDDNIYTGPYSYGIDRRTWDGDREGLYRLESIKKMLKQYPKELAKLKSNPQYPAFDMNYDELVKWYKSVSNFTLQEAKKKKKKNPPLNKPKRGGSKAYYVYVKDPRTKKVKKVSFGSGGLKAKINNKKARNAFAARHKCSTKTDKTKAGYWSCRLPRYAKLLGLKSSFTGFW